MNFKYITLNDGTKAKAVAPINTAGAVVSGDFTYVTLSTGVFVQAIIPIDENDDVATVVNAIDEADVTTGAGNFGYVLLDDGYYAQAVVFIDRSGNII